MSENLTTNPIGSVSMDTASVALPKTQVKAQKAEEASGQEKLSTQIQAKAETTQVMTASNISVHFRVNDETNELTVFVVDRENKKILRTIPASEFSKLNAGDIVQLTA